MLEMISIVLLILWVLGMLSSHTLGGFIHLLFILAVIVGMVRYFQGKRPR
ncbi:MAG: lmo0937 family membrane protein [Elusimicrobia bacterium]|nr:lmo0937 family membrane protein [Elusimicrobiota bacterium]MBK8871921.1 lmo0937 family membrane protein [Elusimicrobiota bacterium]